MAIYPRVVSGASETAIVLIVVRDLNCILAVDDFSRRSLAGNATVKK